MSPRPTSALEADGSAGRPWRVWVTRSRPGATATAAAVRARGHLPLTAPLVAVQPLDVAAPDLDGVAALAFTSAAGVRAFAALSPRRDRSVFAVGRATAAAARACGFADVRDADGSGRDLAAAVAAAAPGGGVLVPGAREPAFDLPAALRAAGVAAQALAVYATLPTPAPTRLRVLLAAGRLDAVLLQSASAARALAALASEDGAPTRPLLLALSPACLPAGTEWPSRTAAAPRERDLLALLPRLDRPVPAR